MRMPEALDMKGRLTLRRTNTVGNLVEQRQVGNAIVLGGRDLVSKLFIGEQVATIKYVAVGTGVSVVDPLSNDQLDNELFRKELEHIELVKDPVSVDEGDSRRMKVVLSADLGFEEGNGELTEAGLFNDEVEGVMYNRVTFPPINKTKDFQLTLIWEILF